MKPLITILLLSIFLSCSSDNGHQNIGNVMNIDTLGIDDSTHFDTTHTTLLNTSISQESSTLIIDSIYITNSFFLKIHDSLQITYNYSGYGDPEKYTTTFILNERTDTSYTYDVTLESQKTSTYSKYTYYHLDNRTFDSLNAMNINFDTVFSSIKPDSAYFIHREILTNPVELQEQFLFTNSSKFYPIKDYNTYKSSLKGQKGIIDTLTINGEIKRFFLIKDFCLIIEDYGFVYTTEYYRADPAGYNTGYDINAMISYNQIPVNGKALYSDLMTKY